LKLIRPRLTDYHGIHKSQEALDFAIPFLDEDIPLYLDPFLLWKSPSLSDQALHRVIIDSFNRMGEDFLSGDQDVAIKNLVSISECEEIGLGSSATKKGKRISIQLAEEILAILTDVSKHTGLGVTHIEMIPLLVHGIGKDRISDFSCSLIKSHLADFTLDRCQEYSIPLVKTELKNVYDYKTNSFSNKPMNLPCNPENGDPILLLPKRWLRFNPWITYDDYFVNHCPQDDIGKPGEVLDRVKVLKYNQDNFDQLIQYVEAKERTSADCKNDPLFNQIHVTSAKKSLSQLKKIPSGNKNMAARKYEDNIVKLLASMLYPHLDFAKDQSRTESGAQIRDLIFYNGAEHPFLKKILAKYNSHQIVFEIKNVKSLERDHVNQVNRYMTDSLGKFGVIVTRNAPTKARRQSIIDLWSGQRRCILVLTDEDIAQMAELFESKQRDPIDVLTKKYAEFERDCPA
jgi:hypothetical protein